MCIVGAIVGAGVLGAAGTAVAGHEAAQATESSTNAAIAQQNAALKQQAELSAPYRALGQGAIPQLQNLLGLTKGANPQAALAATPGYQFARQQGLQGVTNQASAMGLGLSGNTLEGLQRYGTGLADQTYQEAVRNAQSVVGLGQAAAAGQAANVGQGASNISNALIGQGQTLAGIDANTIAGLTKSLGGIGDQYVLANTLKGLGTPSTTATPSVNSGGNLTLGDGGLGSLNLNVGTGDLVIPNTGVGALGG